MAGLSFVRVTSLLRNVTCSLPRRPYSRNVGDLQPKVTPKQTYSDHTLYRNQTRPSDIDKKFLLWSGRYKKREDIPEYVSSDTIAAARSNLRIKACMAMIGGTILGCILMVRSGKKAIKNEQSLVKINLEKKAKLKEETERERMESLKN